MVSHHKEMWASFEFNYSHGSASSMAITLGLDSSTQSLSALVIDTTQGKILVDESLNFGAELPQYDSPNGYLLSDEQGVVHANPLMWLEALDTLLEKIKKAGFDFSKVVAVSGAGQQHGSVFLNESYFQTIGSLNANESLSKQLAPCLARATSPIWMDSATTDQCHQISEAIPGGSEEITRRTGSIPTKRFTGPQIRRFHHVDPNGYRVTARIHLVSSFLSSILAGADSPIDPGDGAGMNLMNLASNDWDASMLAATAPDLDSKLPKIDSANHTLGTISPYFTDKYGFSPKCKCVVWTGDNPSSLVGMGAALPGKVVISLGTSDTLFTSLAQPVTDPSGVGHVFGNPWGNYMSLVCYSSGSLAREQLKDELQLTWDDFEKASQLKSQVTKEMLPYFQASTSPEEWSKALEKHQYGLDPHHQLRMLLEWQFLTMFVQSGWMQTPFETVYVTGGASVNSGIRQTIADVFGAKVYRLESSNSSCLGGALRAAHAANGIDRQELIDSFCRLSHEKATLPREAVTSAYRSLA